MKAFVTGASRGIGLAIKNEFLAARYEVVSPTRTELDLLDDKSIERYVAQFSEITFDVIVNNAGINEINILENITDKEISDTFQANVIAPIKLLRAFVPNMKAAKYGKIVNIGSIWAAVSKPGRALYSATKNAVHGITNTLAVELAPYHILVNTVCPGFTLTELTIKNNTAEQIQEIAKDIPLGRMASPSEIAKVVRFLASEENSYLTGQKIIIDGGFTSK